MESAWLAAGWKSVLAWSLLAGVVGLIIRFLEERLSFFGRLVAGVIGVAWSVASIFAIPLLVLEPSLSSPFKVLSRSAATIKRTWGEMLAGYVGMRGTNLLVLWVSILFWGSAGFAAFQFSNAWVLLFAGVPWLLALVADSYLASVANRVHLCAPLPLCLGRNRSWPLRCSYDGHGLEAQEGRSLSRSASALRLLNACHSEHGSYIAFGSWAIWRHGTLRPCANHHDHISVQSAGAT
jgi:hypothetical protein